MSFENDLFGPILDPPYSCCSISRSRYDQLSVLAECDVRQWLRVTSQRGDGPTVRE